MFQRGKFHTHTYIFLNLDLKALKICSYNYFWLEVFVV
ncbi:unnamed protein product [Gulo gulo]|uniref:Uncharacterized protein n=1 Tax=Gulo gulo TaxID=48420 RepID=A0A9X9PV00_GULGU|nr:unnamed protein product [Gulo gulo]